MRLIFQKESGMSDTSGHGETGPSSKLKPEHISEHAARAGISPGWWAVDSNGKPIMGPYPNEETALLEIAVARRRSAFILPPSIDDAS